MDNLNNKYVTNYVFPMKICYLKDEIKQPPEGDENPSLAYLSSIIQSERKRSSSSQQQFTKPNPFTRTNTSKKQPFKEKLPLKTYYRWKSMKEKRRTQQKPYLIQLVGNNWNKHENNSSFFKSNLQKKLTRDEEKIKKNNDKKLKQQFYQFVRNNHFRPDPQPQPQPTFLTNKPDQKILTDQKHNRNARHLLKFKPKTSEPTTRDNTQQLRIKRTRGFYWSRLSEAHNYSLV